MLNTNKLKNKKLFSKIYNAIEDIVNIIGEKFEEIYSVKKQGISNILKKSLYTVLINACTRNNLEKKKVKKYMMIQI